MQTDGAVDCFGAQVESFGVGTKVRLPGNSADTPNIYDFDSVTYEQIYQDLKGQDPVLYRRNGLLTMLERNMSVKRGPQRWQDQRDLDLDVVITFEERVFNLLVDDVNQRSGSGEALLVVNMDVVDRHEEALVAGPQVVRLCNMLNEAGEEWVDAVDDIMEHFMQDTGRAAVFTVCFT